MPGGKIPSELGGIGFVSRKPLSPFVWKMRRLAKRGFSPPNRTRLNQLSGELRAAFREYQIRRNGAVTATARKKVVKGIESKAQKVLRDPNRLAWRLELARSLSCTLDRQFWTQAPGRTRRVKIDRQLRIKLSYSLLKAVRTCSTEHSELHLLENELEGGRALTDAALNSISILTDIGEKVRLTRSPWPDPELFRLIQAIAPIWTEITGRSLKLVSVDAECSRKRSPFATAVRASFRYIGLQPPPLGRINDIVRVLEN